MLRAGGHQVDAGSLNAAVPQQVRQLDDVPTDPVKDCGEQVSQVMGKHLAWLHTSVLAQPFQFCLDLTAAQLSSASGAKDRARGDLLFLRVFQ